MSILSIEKALMKNGSDMNSKCEFIVKKDEFNISMGTREEHGPAPCPFCGRIII